MAFIDDSQGFGSFYVEPPPPLEFWQIPLEQPIQVALPDKFRGRTGDDAKL